MTRKVPVAWMIRTRLMQSLDALEHQFDGCLHVGRTQHLDNLLVNLIDSKRFVDASDVVFIDH